MNRILDVMNVLGIKEGQKFHIEGQKDSIFMFKEGSLLQQFIPGETHDWHKIGLNGAFMSLICKGFSIVDGEPARERIRYIITYTENCGTLGSRKMVDSLISSRPIRLDEIFKFFDHLTKINKYTSSHDLISITEIERGINICEGDYDTDIDKLLEEDTNEN